MEKIIEDLIKRLNNLEERLNMLENKSYDSDTVFVDSILKYNVIRVNFDADSKHILQQCQTKKKLHSKQVITSLYVKKTRD